MGSAASRKRSCISMANIALGSASSALSALNTQLDIIANNLANVNTVGYKSSRANFQDLLYIEKQQPGTENANGDERPIGLYIGLGVKVSGTHLNFEQGSAMTTDRPLDIMVNGRGFFAVEVGSDISSDSTAYTRAGAFTLNSDGDIVMASDTGRRLVPTITIPDDVDLQSITITNDGEVFGTVGGDVQSLGNIEIATFINPTGLKQIGENLFVPTIASGDANTGEPGTDGRGTLMSGRLEASNVDPARELINLIRTQRAFEMNSQAIRAADETMRTVAQLRR